MGNENNMTRRTLFGAAVIPKALAASGRSASSSKENPRPPILNRYRRENPDATSRMAEAKR